MSSLAQGMGLDWHCSTSLRAAGTVGMRAPSASVPVTEALGAAHTLEGREGIQRDMDRLEKGACANLMEFSAAKCKVLWTGVQVGQRMD